LHLGIAAQELMRLEVAHSAYQRALEVKPDYVQAKWRCSVIALLKGEFDRAWADYELRHLSEDRPQRHFQQARWRGESLAGKTLLVHAEQGLGDEILFASCLPDVLALAQHCVIDCHPKVAPIFRRSFPAATVHGGYQTQDASWLEDFPRPDYQIAVGSLCQLLRNHPGDFPLHAGYLRADPHKAAAWKARLDAMGPELKVGLSWQGGTQLSRGGLRSLTLQQLLPVLQVQGVEFVDLQYTDSTLERGEIEQHHGIRVAHWQEAIDDYDETAALIVALDLTLSVCTSVVDLAGALGRPVWVMTPFSPDWRFGCAGERMAWYPAAKLFRQQRRGEWGPVIAAIAGDLVRLAKSRERE
jgi:hypothetical protein